MDPLGSNIDAHTRGSDLLRILPRVNEEVNEEWISDKTRFAIDGLSTQRLDKVYTKKNDKLLEDSWDNALLKIQNELKKRNPEKTISISGKFTDIETLFSSKQFLDSIGSKFYDCRFDNAQFIEDHPES